MVHGEEVQLETAGFSDIHDITGEVQAIVTRSGARSGIVSVFVIGSTASVSTIEFEPALVADMQGRLEAFAPRGMPTRHGATWGDDNGFSHLRATFMGPGITAPFSGGKLILGTWQQIVVIDHDNRPRSRRIHVQVVGE
jgi:secondary thiamine-phosphate synthase enzyme